MKLSLPILSTVACSALSLFCHAQDAKTYILNIDRPGVVGEKSAARLKFQSFQSQKEIMGERVLKESKEEINAEVEGVREVLAMSPGGKLQKFKFTVEKFSIRKDTDAAVDALKKGSAITGEVLGSGRISYTSDSGDLSPLALRVMKELFSLNPDRPNDAKDDVVFGTDRPRAVGSEWEVDKAAMILSMPSEMPFKLTEQDISGKVKFTAVKQIDGKEHGMLEADVVMKPKQMTGLPPGFELEKGELLTHLASALPIDKEAIAPETKMSMEAHIIISGATPQGKVSLETKNRTTREAVATKQK